jgi:hypothetical protein
MGFFFGNRKMTSDESQKKQWNASHREAGFSDLLLLLV